MILDQVTNGVAVRMAVCYLLTGGAERPLEDEAVPRAAPGAHRPPQGAPRQSTQGASA